MVEGVSERVDTPTDRTRLSAGCSTVVIFCCRFGGDHASAAPVLSRRLTRRLTERTGEVGLARKFEGQRNIDQRLVPFPEQLFAEFKPLRADIVMRRSADRDLERAGKMEAAQACDCGGFDVPPRSAIKRASCAQEVTKFGPAGLEDRGGPKPFRPGEVTPAAA